ncbi:MAG: transposase [Prevotella sp.]|nr:transposase [Prevotella sp.]
MDYPTRIQHRLKGFDYKSTANYFITIVTQNRWNLFGNVVEGKMILNQAGLMVWDKYRELARQIEQNDQQIITVMPNHIHFVLFNYTHETENVVTFIQTFKRWTTNEYIKGVREKGWQPFDKKLWQRDYYDHVIRNQRSYDYIVDYIKDNPERWEHDKLNDNCSQQPDNINEEIRLLEIP